MPSAIACDGAVMGPDGLCANCGRRVRFEEQWGRVAHVRGRIRGKAYAPPVRFGRAVPGAPVIRVRIKAVVHRRCPDCDAPLDEFDRCPWTTSTRFVDVNGVLACNWPKGQKPPVVVAERAERGERIRTGKARRQQAEARRRLDESRPRERYLGRA